jgi:hypothetical protein
VPPIGAELRFSSRSRILRTKKLGKWIRLSDLADTGKGILEESLTKILGSRASMCNLALRQHRFELLHPGVGDLGAIFDTDNQGVVFFSRSSRSLIGSMNDAVSQISFVEETGRMENRDMDWAEMEA